MIPFFLGASSGAPAPGTVFATTLYTGNGSSQTVTSGISLSTLGGLVWAKGRSGATNHALYDTLRGTTIDWETNSSAAETTQATGLTAFGTTGFTLGALAKVNTSSETYVAWSFARAARFFDVVTWTGDGTSGRTINHNLGVAPGMMIVKSRSAAAAGTVYHRSLGNGFGIDIDNISTADSNFGYWNNTSPTASNFTIGNSGRVNTNLTTYVAYLFAHDTAGDGIVQCGYYVGNGSASGPAVTLGWQPQFLMIKNRSTSGDGWLMLDSTRGVITSGNDQRLSANSNAAENAVNRISFISTGFSVESSLSEVNTNGDEYIYLAIRSA